MTCNAPASVPEFLIYEKFRKIEPGTFYFVIKSGYIIFMEDFTLKIYTAIILSVLMVLSAGLISCDKEKGAGDSAVVSFDAQSERVIIEMEDGGIIKLELYPDQAPITVANFVKLVNEGFYDGLIFHRVISGFMIQGGDPEGTGMGGSDETIKGEFASNGVVNPISHERGVISMARSKAYNSASSQFFIMHQDNEGLDGDYAAFGKVVEGMDVVDRIASTQVDRLDAPTAPQVIKEIRIG